MNFEQVTDWTLRACPELKEIAKLLSTDTYDVGFSLGASDTDMSIKLIVDAFPTGEFFLAHDDAESAFCVTDSMPPSEYLDLTESELESRCLKLACRLLVTLKAELKQYEYKYGQQIRDYANTA